MARIKTTPKPKRQPAYAARAIEIAVLQKELAESVANLKAERARNADDDNGKANDVPTEVINHPAWYNNSPSGVECITVTEHMNFNVGNAIKYLWRADAKDSSLENLRKALWYVDREIGRRQRFEKD